MGREVSIEVVIPAFNAARFIVAALQSVVGQTCPPLRVIVVDDGSSDGTPTLVREFAASNPAVPIECIEQGNAGPAAARNAGLRMVRADFVALVDADDMWAPDKLEKQMACFTQSGWPDLGMVYCNYAVMDSDGNAAEDPRRATPLLRGHIVRQLARGNQIAGSASAVLIRTAALHEVGLFDEALVCAEDWDLWLRIAERYAIDFVDEKLVMVRKHGDNAQRNERRMLGGELAFANKLFLARRLRAVHWLRLLARMRRESVSLDDYPQLRPGFGMRCLYSPVLVATLGRAADWLWRARRGAA